MKVQGSASYEYVVIPHKAGLMSIPPIEFTYFDPVKKRYQTLRSKKFDITVTEDKNMVSYNSGLNKEEIRILDEDIRFIVKDNVKWQRSGTAFYQNGTFVAINLASLLLL